MNCKICEKELLNKKSKSLCSECYNKKWEVKCVNCEKQYSVTAHYFIQIDTPNHRCKQCKLKGEGNPNYGNKWSDELKNKVSEIIKSKVDEKYRLNCAKGMQGKTVSNETKIKRKETLIKRYGKLSNTTGHTKQSLEIISLKSKNKFTPEYLKKVRKVNEERGNWIPLDVKNDYYFYRDLSNWKCQVLNYNIVGIELLKNEKLYDKKNPNKNALIRDHMYGRKSGFNNKVFPELLRHPANCQLITHGDNIKKSKLNNDCVIDLNELFDKILLWDEYEEQNLCLSLIEKYKMGERYSKEKYIKTLYNQNKS
jgi:hypothetical protein